VSIGIYRRLERSNILNFMVKHAETSVTLHQLTVRSISGELNLQQHHSKNFESHTSALFIQSLRSIRIIQSVRNTLIIRCQ